MAKSLVASATPIINPPTRTPTIEGQLQITIQCIGTVKKYIIAENNIMIAATISKYATPVATTTAVSRSISCKENCSRLTLIKTTL